MKFAPIVLLLAVAAASPVYQVEWVTVTKYTTIVAGHDEYTSAFPQTSAAAVEAGADSAPTEVSSIEQLNTQSYSVQTIATDAANAATTAAATPTTSSSQTVATTSSTQTSSATSGSVFSGDGTYYSTGLGACGWVNVDTDYIAAIGHGLFDQYTTNGNPNDNSLCGKKIIAHYEGNSVEVTAVDRCEGCSEYDLDFSPSAFSQLADQSLGRIKITWEWA